MLRSFLKDSIIYSVPSFISRGLSFLLVPLYTRVLTPDDYGAFDLFLMFTGIINLTIALEISQAVARFYTTEIDKLKKVIYASTAYWFTIGCYLIFVFSAFLFSHDLSRIIMGDKGFERIFQIGLVHIFLFSGVSLMQNQLRWELRSKAYAILSIAYTLVTASVSVWLAYFQQMGLEGLLWGMASGGLIGFMVGTYQLRDSFRLYFSRSYLAAMLRFSAPLVPAGIAVWVSGYADRFMINYFLSLEEVGLYGIGFRLAGIVTLIMVGFQAALTPLIYTHYNKPDTPFQLARIFRIFLTFCLLFFTGMNLFVEEILMLFTGPAFFDAKIVVIYLVPAILLSQMYIFAPGIFIVKKTSFVIWINLVGAVVNVLLNFVLIPFFGIVGAALATLLGHSLVFYIYMFFSQRFYPVSHNWKRIITVTVTVVLIVVLVSNFSVTGFWFYIARLVAILLVLLSIILIKLVDINELKIFRLKIIGFMTQLKNIT